MEIIIKSRNIYSVNEMIAWVKSHLVWDRSTELAAKSMRLGGPVSSCTEQPERVETKPEPTAPTMEDLVKMITAIQGGAGGNRGGRRTEKDKKGDKSRRSGSPRTLTPYGNESYKG